MQATVQAALALSPLDAVIAAYKRTPKSAEALRYTQYANETLTTAVFCILISASIGTLLIRLFGPVLLERVSEFLAAFLSAALCCIMWVVMKALIIFGIT